MAKYYVEVDSDGDIFWHNDPDMLILHREDGPAIELAKGDKFWYKDGLRHRDGGPAVELASGYKVWCVNGNNHREDGPAVEYPHGKVEYWLNNKKFSKKKWEDALRPPEELTVAQIEQLLGKRIKVVK